MPTLLKLDSYAPVLEMLGQRPDTEGDTILWIVSAFVGILLLLLAASTVRSRIRRRLHHGRSMDQLEQLSARHDLDYVEQVTLERIAKAAKLKNPAQLVTAVDMFDQAVGAWMERVQKMPWLEMEEQVARLTRIREKLEFRYLPPERKPTNTRHIPIDHRLYVLASGKTDYRLLKTTVIDLDDLAIRTALFSDKNAVRLPLGQDFMAFFYSDDGGEYRFKTRILKALDRPSPFLYLRHGDALASDDGRKTISCDLDVDLVADRLPAADVGRANASPNLFGRLEAKIQSLPAHLNEVSGSGFAFATQESTEVNDLLRIQGGKGVPSMLDGKSARVVKVTSSRCFAKFLKLGPEEREALLAYITPRVSKDAFKNRTERRAPAKA